MSQPYTATNRVMHEWGIGGLAWYWMSAVIYSFVANVFISSYEMDPVWVGLAMMVPRLLDIVIDPLVGRLSDNTHSRWGRRRPFILVTTLVGAVLVVGIWRMPLDWVEKALWTFSLPHPSLEWAGLHPLLSWVSSTYTMPWSFPYLLIFTTLLYVNLGVFDMSHTALGYELSDDYNQRSKVQAVRMFYFSMGGLLGAGVYWLAQRSWFGQGHLGEVNGFRCLSLVMAAIILVFGLLPFFACRERFQNVNRTHVAIWPALKATLKNRPFVIILALRLINILGNSLFGAMVFFIAVYSLFGGDKEWYNALNFGTGIAGFVLGAAMVRLAVPITRWLGKRRGLIVCIGLGLVSAVLTPFYMWPGHPYVWFCAGLFFMPATVVLGNITASIMPDICDLDELQYGERREGLFTAVLSFMGKLESSLCLGLGGVMLKASGFDQHLLQQPPEVLEKMRLYAFTPLIGGASLTFIVACFFPLSKEKMDRVRAELDARHAALAVGTAEGQAKPETKS